jgi:hypothetical protein
MLVLGLTALGIAWRAAPPAPVDLRARLIHFGTVEQTALDTYNDAVRKHQGGQLSPDEFARVIETVVLPPWRETREQFDGINPQRLPADARPAVAKLRQYMTLREEAWTARAAGLRDNDPARFDEAAARDEAADRLGREISLGDSV